MKFAYCCSLEEAQQIDDLGFDAFEVNANSLSSLSEEAYQKQRAAFAALKTPIRSTNVFFSGDMRLVAEDRDLDQILAYVERTIRRASELGAKVMVFGSGGARRYHAPMTYQEAIRQLISLLEVMSPIAERYGVKIVLEPLNYSETNIINTLDEAAALVAAMNLPAIGLLADLFHLAYNGETMEDLTRLAPIDHIHIATAGDRRVPVTEEAMKQLLEPIFASGYDQQISIEGGSDNIRVDAERALKLFRSMLALNV